jgi:hypothetical protein
MTLIRRFVRPLLFAAIVGLLPPADPLPQTEGLRCIASIKCDVAVRTKSECLKVCSHAGRSRELRLSKMTTV